MTKHAVTLAGPAVAVEATQAKLKKVHGGETPLEILANFIKETFRDVRAVAIEQGKVIIDVADDVLQTIIEAMSNLIHARYHQKVNIRSEVCA